MIELPPFACVPRDQWILGKRIVGERRQRLLQGVSFEEIVNRIAKEASLSSYKPGQSDHCPGFHRVEIKLATSPKTVDLFHNSRCGYRAQYYLGVKTGEQANRYVIRGLLPRLEELVSGDEESTCPWMWAKKSLLDREAKVWIHQGVWLRLQRKVDRNLNVQRWTEACLNAEPGSRDRKLARWGSLAPAKETRIDIKGGYIDLSGTPLGKSLKPTRSEDIHRLGFT